METWHLMQHIQAEGYTRQVIPPGFAATLRPQHHSGGS